MLNVEKMPKRSAKMSAAKSTEEENAMTQENTGEQPTTAYIVNEDGSMLYCERWQPDTQPRALAFISHGMAEHIGYYREISKELLQHSIYVFAHDHVGHGRSEGIRVYVKSFSEYVRDVFQHIDLIQKKHPSLPIFIIGHSMGGAIAIKSAMQRPDFFRGVILVGPAISVNPEVATPLKVFLAKAISRIIPKFPVGFLEYDSITRDKSMLEFIKKDNLRHHGAANAKWSAEFIDTMQEIHNDMASVKWPFLILHGECDKLADISGSKAFHSSASSKDKELKVYKDAFHNLICEVVELRQEVMHEVCKWIVPRINKQ